MGLKCRPAATALWTSTVRAAGRGTGWLSAAMEKSGNLVEFIDKDQIACLNEKGSNRIGNALDGSETYLESDADHQLLINIGFRQAVKLSGIKIHSVDDDS